MKKNKIYFASDFHLGRPTLKESHDRERLIILWLDEIKKDAKSIYLLGDIFDFWFEYKKVVPKGFVRVLGKLAELNDCGINIHLFTGNHDMWMKDYLKNEIGLQINYTSAIIQEQSKKLFIGHGDGLGNGDYFYKFLKKIFTAKICRWAFARLHPNFAISIAHAWSNNSRNRKKDDYVSDNKELLLTYCKKEQQKDPVDYYIFGHRHIPLEIVIDNVSKYVNIGDWISHNTYAVLSDGKLYLKTYKATKSV